MRARLRRTITAASALLLVLALTSPLVPASASVPTSAVTAAAAYPPDDYCLGECADILPPGENGNATLAEILAHQALGHEPSTATTSSASTPTSLSGYTGLTDDQITSFFNDASFGVPAGQVESTVSPRSDVTIVRDKATGVPHITGTTRDGTMFGAGYAGAQDRLWVMDLMRHVGRGELTSFAGGAPGNRAAGAERLAQRPVHRGGPAGADRQAQGLRPPGRAALRRRAALHRRYQRLHRPLHGEPRLPRRVRADRAPRRDHQRGRPGDVHDDRPDRDLRRDRRPVRRRRRRRDAVRAGPGRGPRQVRHGGRRPGLGGVPRAERPGGRRSPCTTARASRTAPRPPAPPGSSCPTRRRHRWTSPRTRRGSATAAAAASATCRQGRARRAARRQRQARHVQRRGGLGGQVGDRAPGRRVRPADRLLRPAAAHAAGAPGPGISARGAAFAGLNLYVLLGRGPDYAWSATSSGQDITDTYAVQLCEPDGGAATTASNHYLYHGVCTAMETLRKTNSWKPTVADSTAAGSYDLVRPAHEVRAGELARHGRRGADRVHHAALDVPARGRLGDRLPDVQRPGADGRRGGLPELGLATSASRSTGSTSNSTDTAYFNSGTTRSGRRSPTRTCRCRPTRPTSGRAGTRPPTPRPTPPPPPTRRRSTRTTSSAGTTSRPRTTAPRTATSASARCTAPTCWTPGSRRPWPAAARSTRRAP